MNPYAYSAADLSGGEAFAFDVPDLGLCVLPPEPNATLTCPNVPENVPRAPIPQQCAGKEPSMGRRRSSKPSPEFVALALSGADLHSRLERGWTDCVLDDALRWMVQRCVMLDLTPEALWYVTAEWWAQNRRMCHVRKREVSRAVDRFRSVCTVEASRVSMAGIALTAQQSADPPWLSTERKLVRRAWKVLRELNRVHDGQPFMLTGVKMAQAIGCQRRAADGALARLNELGWSTWILVGRPHGQPGKKGAASWYRFNPVPVAPAQLPGKIPYAPLEGRGVRYRDHPAAGNGSVSDPQYRSNPARTSTSAAQ